MIKRCWIVTITSIALLIFISLGQSKEEGKGEQRESNAQKEPTQAYLVPILVKIISDNAAAKARKRREEESRQREKDDLVAQQGMNTATQAMNKATQEMALYAEISMFLVGLGTFLLIWTLYLTRQANQAAIQSVKITQEIGQAQTAAYLAIIGGGYILNYGGFSGWADVINTGNSPAINPFLKFDIRLENAWFGQSIMGSSPEPFYLPESIGRKSKIQPNETSRFYFYWSADEFGDRFKSLDNERTTIIISCKVESKTIYKGITDKGEWDLTNYPGFVRVSDRSKISEGVLYTRQRQRR